MLSAIHRRIVEHLTAAAAAFAFLGPVAIVAGCSGTGATDPPGNAETDRIARVVADAISYPRQDDAEGLARAALATGAGEDGRLTVIAAEDLEAGELTDPLAQLVFRIHLVSSEPSFGTEPPITACYDAQFNHYGIIDEPRRANCPSGDVEPVVPPPPPPTPTLPTDADARLRTALDGLSDTQRTDPDVVLATVEALALTDIPPEVAPGRGAIGVAMRSGDDCLLARVAGQVEVWTPHGVYLEPGEVGCDAGAAADGLTQRPPH